ncbi:MAG: dihydropteroate synthase [Cellvibrionales bacterium]|nr:dihydropteroate synthase [Cellvibrionales bacterium]
MFLDSLDLDRPHIMGIINVTPDSFSDGGQLFALGAPNLDRVYAVVEKMQQSGATFVDVGGQTTKPGFERITPQEEIDRVVPVIQGIKERFDLCISVDTSTPDVMAASIESGAGLVNDVEALADEAALTICAEKQVPVVLMHSFRGEEGIHSKGPLAHLIQDELNFFHARIKRCINAGIESSNIIIDPGFGFGKSLDEYKILLNQLSRFSILACPILVGLSRKKTISTLLGGRELNQRMAGGLGLSVLAYQQGARIFRTHDVAETYDALMAYSKIQAS